MQFYVSTAISLILCCEEHDIKVRRFGYLKGDVHPIFEFLKGAGLYQWRVEMSREKPRIGWYLRAMSPCVIANGNDGPAGSAGEVANRERIGGDMQPDALHERYRSHLRHLRAV